MANIGQLALTRTPDYDRFVGSVATLKLSIPLEILTNGDKPSDNSPTHIVHSHNEDGLSVEIGAAWLRDATRGAQMGKSFLSIVIDDPSLNAAMNLVAFPSQDPKFPDTWNILWRRRNAQKGSENFSAA